MTKQKRKILHRASLERRLAVATLAAVVAMAIGARSAHAGVAFTVGYDYVETEISPQQGTYRTHMVSTYHVSGDKGVTFSSSSGVKAQSALGHMVTVTDQLGQPVRVSYRVAGGAFIISGSSSGLRSVVRVVTDGHSSCTATRQFGRMPGHKFYDVLRTSNREPMVDSDVHAENVTCSVSEAPD